MKEEVEQQRILDFLRGLYRPSEDYHSLVEANPPLFSPTNQAHRYLAYFWIHRLHFPVQYRGWPPPDRLLALFEGKLDVYERGNYDPQPFLREHQRLLPRSLSPAHPYPWHLEEDERLVREAERDRQSLAAWITSQYGGASVSEQTHLSRARSQLGSQPFRWGDFLAFVRHEWQGAETAVLGGDHPFLVAQHAVYGRLREQLAAMGRLA